MNYYKQQSKNSLPKDRFIFSLLCAALGTGILLIIVLSFAKYY